MKLQFRNGTALNIGETPLSEHHRKLIDSLVKSRISFIINTNLSPAARQFLVKERTFDFMRTQLYDSRLVHPNDDIEVLDRNTGLSGHLDLAARVLSRDLNRPILINVEINPEAASHLQKRNSTAEFVIAGCQITNGNLNVGILGDSGDVWIDEQAIEVPKFKNEPCVSPGVKLFKDLMDVVSDDVSVPAVTLKQLQDKAVQYDELKKQLDEIRAKSQPMIEIAERYERVRVLFETEYENEDLEAHEFIEKIKDVLDGKEEPETFDRADYRDE